MVKSWHYSARIAFIALTEILAISDHFECHATLSAWNMNKATPVMQPEGVVQLLNPTETEDTVTLEFSGYWQKNANIRSLDSLLTELNGIQVRQVVMQSNGLHSWDSRLPSYLLKIAEYCEKRSIEMQVSALPEGVQSLLKLARTVPERLGARRSEQHVPLLVSIGKGVLHLMKDSYNLIVFIGEFILTLGTLLRGKARFRMIDLLICIQDAGPGGLPITTLISLLVGLILAFVGALQLAMFGAQIYIADLVALGTVREMGPLMTAVIMSGRTGASYAAQLGTMNVNSEIDALRTMGISPQEFLVLPRMLGLILVMPLLCLYADLMGITGGAIISLSFFDLSYTQYFNEVRKAVDLQDFLVGLFKSLIFAVLIAIAGCMRGMQCGRSASAVGEATTSAVVDSIVYIVVADSILTLICNQLGI